MTVESDFRAMLAADGSLVAAVGSRISEHAVPQGSAYPQVIFTSDHAYERGIDNTLLADDVTFTVQCWAKSAAEAWSVANLVRAACDAASDGKLCTVSAAEGIADEVLGLDGVELTVEWLG